MPKKPDERLRITLESNGDPDEPGLHPWESGARRLTADLIKSGMRCYEMEPEPEGETRYTVNFISGKKSSVSVISKPVELCPACKIELDHRGRCRACFGDVFGLCEVCGSILEGEGGPCSTCQVQKR